MTNYDGRCRGGWAFGQGFDSPQVHRKRGLRVYSQASFSMDLRGKLGLVKTENAWVFGRGAGPTPLRKCHFRTLCRKKSGVKSRVQKWAKKDCRNEGQ